MPMNKLAMTDLERKLFDIISSSNNSLHAFEIYKQYVGSAENLSYEEVIKFVFKKRNEGKSLVDYRTVQRILEDMARMGWLQKRTDGIPKNVKAVYYVVMKEVNTNGKENKRIK